MLEAPFTLIGETISEIQRSVVSRDVLKDCQLRG